MYTYRRGLRRCIGVVSALLVSTDRGNAKAYRPWNEQQAGSTFFIFVYQKDIILTAN